MSIDLVYGKSPKLYFKNENEFYYALGFLANMKRTSIHWEHNEDDGAWGSEGRIHCERDLSNFPQAFINKFSEGNPGILKRVNCNDYIICLVRDFKFIQKKYSYKSTVDIIPPDIKLLRSLVPTSFQTDFNAGYIK